MATLNELREARQQALIRARDTGSREDARAVKAIDADIVSLITQGAQPCPDCGAKPHGMVQVVDVHKMPTEMFEVGCLACRDHRGIVGWTPEIAVSNWNERRWKAPKDQS